MEKERNSHAKNTGIQGELLCYFISCENGRYCTYMYSNHDFPLQMQCIFHHVNMDRLSKLLEDLL